VRAARVGRVVLTSSASHFDTYSYGVATDLATLNSPPGGRAVAAMLNPYGQSKLAQVLWAQEATRRLAACRWRMAAREALRMHRSASNALSCAESDDDETVCSPPPPQQRAGGTPAVAAVARAVLAAAMLIATQLTAPAPSTPAPRRRWAAAASAAALRLRERGALLMCVALMRRSPN
jgi:hypothetical protein